MLDLIFGHGGGGMDILVFGCWAPKLGAALGSSMSPSCAVLVLVVWGKVETDFRFSASEWGPIVE